MQVIKRIDWIDSAKGFGILLVVFGHLQSDIAHNYLYSFLMPLFFFISGQLCYDKYDYSIFSYIKLRFKRLLYPYYLWGFLLFIFWLIFDQEDGSIQKNVIGLLFSYGGKEYMQWGVMFWFLPSLFITECVHYIIRKAKNVNNWITIIGLVILGFTLNNEKYILPYNAHTSMVMILFYHIGYTLKNKVKRSYLKHYLIVIICLLWYIIISFNGNVVVYSGDFNNPILFIIGAILGIIIVIYFSHTILRIAIFKILGFNTLIIFMLHLRAITFIKAIQLYLFGIPIHTNLLSSFIYIIIACPVLMIVAQIINKYLPLLIKIDEKTK